MKRKYEKPSVMVVELRQITRLLTVSDPDPFDNGGDPLADE